ncbi:MAG: tRNA (adenosine(37)-N6)-threonylcarbamoyltransferase complex ATPase subunit type 1 TsaE [Verrucomicrobia bacterium]|nr:tRNA (adenosine(37)-N6)-threonylcarbamoyltransferase complex ATPase subunit type 1 TsaE [Verrucomicrobiota bacterium]
MLRPWNLLCLSLFASAATFDDETHTLSQNQHHPNFDALVGNLGAGKTHAAKGIVAGIGSTARVSSPTFTLVHEYGGGRLPVFHFDFYRMESPEEVLGIGWDDYLDAGGVLIIEWADKFAEIIPAHARWFQFTILDEETRRVDEVQGSRFKVQS